MHHFAKSTAALRELLDAAPMKARQDMSGRLVATADPSPSFRKEGYSPVIRDRTSPSAFLSFLIWREVHDDRADLNSALRKIFGHGDQPLPAMIASLADKLEGEEASH